MQSCLTFYGFYAIPFPDPRVHTPHPPLFICPIFNKSYMFQMTATDNTNGLLKS